MKIQTTYKSVKNQYPKETHSIEQKIRTKKNKYNEDEFDTFDWYFNWGVSIKGNTFQELIDGTAHKEQIDWNSMSVEDQVADTVARLAVTIIAKKGKSRVSSDVLSKAPTEIEDFYRNTYQEHKDEQNRINGLSQEKRDKELEEAIRELSKHGGFSIMTIK